VSEQPLAMGLAGQGSGDEASGLSGGVERKMGFILWMTGMSGAGKSTLARAVREHLDLLMPVEFLDGDVKGLYKKALAGELPHFTGISDL